MNSKFKKQAFVFSFLAIFLSFLIFAFASFNLFKGDFSDEKVFNEARIVYVDNEIKYFKEVYIKDALEYSLRSTINALINYTIINNSNYYKINQNYSGFSSLLKEGIINGSFDGISQNFLDNKTITYFVSDFKSDFDKNYKGNFSFKILNMNIFEKNPYYLSLQVLVQYNISMYDNLSSWNSYENFEVSVPVIEMLNPEVFLLTNKSVFIKPYHLYNSENNWSIETLNETLMNSYNIIYTDTDYKYTLGSSFLSGFLNLSTSAYKDVLAFYSFDYDLENKGVYDTSGNSVLGKHYGNTYLLMHFENNTLDSSVYNNSGSTVGDVDCTVNASNYMGCSFDGDDDYINISRDDFNLNFTNKFSISVWVNASSYIDSQSIRGSEIFRYGGNVANVIDLRFSTGGKLIMQIGNHSNGFYYNFKSKNNVTLNEWNHLVGVFDGDTGEGQLYINGEIQNLDENYKPEKSAPIGNFVKSNIDIGIGGLTSGGEDFNGSIDEMAIYTKVLSSEEIAQLYKSGKAEFIDYKDSLHGKGIEFDGVDDYVAINQTIFNNPLSEFTIEVWLKPYSLNTSYEDDLNPMFINLATNKSSGANVLGFSINNNTQIEFRTVNSSDSEDFLRVDYNLSLNKNSYLVFQFNSTNKNIFVNGNLIGSSLMYGLLKPSTGYFMIGADNDGSNNINQHFNGIIDEVKIYNRSLSKEEIQSNYYNYNGAAKGCCNYLTLMNTNKFSFNDTKRNVSSTTYMYNKFLNGEIYNETLWNVTNVTSNVNTDNYYNFLVDQCLLQALSLPYGNQTNLVLSNFGQYNASCHSLIKEGIY